MTDEKLVADAHAFAKELVAKISADKAIVLDGGDGAPWAITMLVEMARLLAVSFVAATDNEEVFPLFMRHVAEGAVTFAVDTRLLMESIREARRAAAFVDAGSETKQ